MVNNSLLAMVLLNSPLAWTSTCRTIYKQALDYVKWKIASFSDRGHIRAIKNVIWQFS